MPLLLRRALAQLRGEARETWPDREKQWPRHYPIPIQLNHLGPVAEETLRAAASCELKKMLERLERANPVRAWAEAAGHADDGLTVLMAMIDAARPVTVMNASDISTLWKKATSSAQHLGAALTGLFQSGTSMAGLLPLPDAETLRAYPKASPATATRSATMGAQGYVISALRDPANLLAMLEHIAKLPDPSIRQRRHSPSKRRAISIAAELYTLGFGAIAAAALASSATGESITPRAITKRRT
jgi:hypothetical protein